MLSGAGTLYFAIGAAAAVVVSGAALYVINRGNSRRADEAATRRRSKHTLNPMRGGDPRPSPPPRTSEPKHSRLSFEETQAVRLKRKSGRAT